MSTPVEAALPLAYEEFDAWHRDHVDRLLGPALQAVNRALDAYFDKELAESQRVRVRVSPGRIKNPARTWRKLNLPQYRSRVTHLDSIPVILDDLIATRITCTNTSDLDRVWELLLLLETWEEGREPVLALEPGSARDYCENPKPTGYRARHVNVRTAVNDGLSRTLVTCEIQVRTLLQDSWGELTHEDTYKPGSKVSPLVTTLARRMADLLATLDEIAEDLRKELDISNVVGEATGAEPSTTDVAHATTEPLSSDSLAVAAQTYLQRRVAALTRPLDLATLAWEIQREFGQEIAAGWLGHWTFKALLTAAVQNIRISNTPPSYVIPGDYRFVESQIFPEIAARDGDLPVPIVFLKGIDKSFPLYPTSYWHRIFDLLASSTSAFRADTVFDARLLNELTRIARDRSQQNGIRLPRSAFDYVARGIWYAGYLKPHMSSGEVGEAFFETILHRVRDAITVSDESAAQLHDWLGLAET